jgi:dephospho-CoA kinase
MYTIGLTGGVGSGKTLVSTLFEAHGICIIDTDKIARDLVAHNTPHLADIVSHFGPTLLLANGHLDRRKLRHLIFEQPAEKQWLESLLHPAIRAVVKKEIAACTTPYCMIVIPLLLESGDKGYEFLDRVAVVDCPEDLQMARTMTRDGITQEQALAMLNAQTSRASRTKAADDIIDNTRDEAYLKSQVEALHRKYLDLSQNS